ncbi:MAG: hypothetical protein KAS39_05225 [Actinomycetia bacterium]|nr:hypothetical protein [Actinomycetes bacterium]
MQDTLGLLNKPRGQGFSKDRMEIFSKIIKMIKEISVKEDRSAYLCELLPECSDIDYVSIEKGRETVKKAIRFVSIPNGICIAADQNVDDSWFWIRTPEQYGDYIFSLSRREKELSKMKESAKIGWYNQQNIKIV